ncbi:hypothetical protein QJS83_07705 [Bdellovibrio sp. 22V]|uniref:hypothetical protein n=1 Tax=Bdellovibrio sp. 22V TaxID=3044166 RepID=UPI002543D631|nr:hypothetical protein [Bdellovibrio sp. 22V]WII73760.1 hypothetical protein QJS83_07705 [Bdellovibrio sp. 22V]
MFGFKYHLLSPHYVPDNHSEFFNKIYAAWKVTFKEVVESAGGVLDPDDFFRCDHVGVITHKNEIVGLSLLTMFDLKLHSSVEHHYIRALENPTQEQLLKRGISRLISIEYLNVLPEWRKSHSNVAWTEVLIGMGLKFMDESVADVIIGMPRIDRKVDQICQNLEGYEIQAPISKMNYPCAVLIFNKQDKRRFKNEITEQYVQSLWKSREIVGIAPFQKQIFKKAV